MCLKVKKTDRDRYIPRAWEYMHSRYADGVLVRDYLLLSEVRALADLMASCEAQGKILTFDQIDMIRYAQDFIEFKGPATLYRIYLLMYDIEGWREYKNRVKGPDRRKRIAEHEKKFNDFLEKERKKNGKNK